MSTDKKKQSLPNEPMQKTDGAKAPCGAQRFQRAPGKRRQPAGLRAGILLSLVLLLSAAGLFAAAAALQAGTAKYRIAMVVKSTESDFWKSVFAGANVAATEYNASLSIAGAKTEDDFAEQNALIRKAIREGADALVLSAVDYEENAAAANEAAEAGMALVVIDSDVNSSAVKSRIGTDNYEAGRITARAVAEQTAGEALNIGIVNFDENTENGQGREAGFREEIVKLSDVRKIDTINVLSMTEDAREKTRRLIEENPELNVIVTFNEWTSLGVGWAIRDLEKQEDIMVVAFDSNTVSVGMLESGEVDALIVQNPYAMGYLGVETACRLLDGKKAEPRVDTATTAVTRENMYQPEHQKILFRFE